jgi:hypothetical protein
MRFDAMGPPVPAMSPNIHTYRGLCHHGLLYMALVGVYYILATLGQTFYAFQWDMLLLETGAITALCYATWTRRAAPKRQMTTTEQNDDDDNDNSDATRSTPCWPLRFLIFKLMFMSGVVKLQANCPTWNQLTALEYHYATQCLPGPLAWHAHQLPPFLQRMSVAATLVIEIPLSLLLILPFGTMRQFGAIVQLLLQVLIILTGNYNFFNVLTIALCLPCLEADSSTAVISTSKYDRQKASSPPSTKVQSEPEPDPRTSPSDGRSRLPYVSYILQSILCGTFVAWCTTQMFDFEWYKDIFIYPGSNNTSTTYRPTVELKWTLDQCNGMLVGVVPNAVRLTFILVALNALQKLCGLLFKNTDTPRKHSKVATIGSVMFQSAFHVACIGATALPLLMLAVQQLHLHPGERMPWKTYDFFLPLWRHVQPYGVANSYGLFRRMTGVGTMPPGAGNNNMGWAGLPPSVVARPELILEGVFRNTTTSTSIISSITAQNAYDDLSSTPGVEEEAEEDVWREINFRWKPGNVLKRPRQVAPHQPRLDWQMWFAALGRYQHNPWLISLMHRLLLLNENNNTNEGFHGNKAVARLLNEPGLVSGQEKLVKLRTVLWDYDFTRMDTEWNRRIPSTIIVKEPLPSYSYTSFPKQYWTRRNRRTYAGLPELKANDPSVKDFLRHHGLLPQRESPSTTSCTPGSDGGKTDRCSAFLFCSPISRHVCSALDRLRIDDNALFWTGLYALLILLAVSRLRARLFRFMGSHQMPNNNDPNCNTTDNGKKNQ